MYLASVFSSGAANVSHVAHSKMEAFVPPFAHQSRFGVPPGAAECAAGDAIIHRQPPRGGPGAGCFFAGSPAGPPFDSLSPPPQVADFYARHVDLRMWRWWWWWMWRWWWMCGCMDVRGDLQRVCRGSLARRCARSCARTSCCSTRGCWSTNWAVLRATHQERERERTERLKGGNCGV